MPDASRIEDIQRSLGEAIRSARKEQELSLPSMARLVGVAVHEMAAIECGQGTLGVELLLRIAMVLEIPPERLYGVAAQQHEEIARLLKPGSVVYDLYMTHTKER